MTKHGVQIAFQSHSKSRKINMLKELKIKKITFFEKKIKKGGEKWGEIITFANGFVFNIMYTCDF